MSTIGFEENAERILCTFSTSTETMSQFSKRPVFFGIVYAYTPVSKSKYLLCVISFQASDAETFWDWLEGQFVPGIYADEWYNKQKVKSEEYISNKKSILLGMPRLRQLRIQKGYGQVCVGF